MSNYDSQYNQKVNRVAQQAVKSISAQDTPAQEVVPAPPVRHRRSDRYKAEGRAAAEESFAPRRAPSPYAPQPQEAEEATQWVRRTPPAAPGMPQEGDGHADAFGHDADRQSFMRRPVALENEYDDEEDEREGGGRALRVALIVLLALAMICAALYFVPSAGPLNPLKNAVMGAVNSVKQMILPEKKEPAAVLSFQSVTDACATNSRVVFQLTTNQSADGVRLEDAAGNEIPGTVSLVNSEDENNKVWAITTTFTEPCTGNVYAAVKEGSDWTRSPMWVALTVTEPTPVPTQAPAPTQAPVPTQAPAPTQSASVALPPVVAETQAPTQAPAPTQEPVAQTPAPVAALAPEVVSFRRISGERAYEEVVFELVVDGAAEEVGLQDWAGDVIPAKAEDISAPGDAYVTWRVTAVFDYTGETEVYPAVRFEGEWIVADSFETISLAAGDEPLMTPFPVQGGDTQETPASQPFTAPTNVPVPTWAAQPIAQPDDNSDNWGDDWGDIAGEPTDEPVYEPIDEPVYEPTDEPTAEPTAEPTPAPTATPFPRLTAEAGVTGLKSTDTVLIGGKTQSNYSRKESLIAPNPDEYAYYGVGVLTFRGDNFRRNAAFGTAAITEEKMSVIWQSDIGSLRTADNGTLYGVGWTGQPAIIKWTTEVRQMMNLYESKKNTKALREVIFGAQDGKIYFLDLKTGEPTRDPINVGYPLKGSVAVETYGKPLIAVGQGISKLPGKTGDIGLHVYNLIDGSRAFLINGRKSDSQKQYTTNGAFDGTALFLYNNDAMVVAGENGLLYTVDLGSDFHYPKADAPDEKGSLALNRTVTYLRTKATAEKDANVGVESSVAMYDKYIYMADTYGVLRCVDSDTMRTVWAIDVGDNTDAAIALDMDGDTGVSLYTGNTAYSRLGSKKDVTIRRVNALTGEEYWSYNIKCTYDKNQLSGCKASPIIGQNDISHLAIFTVNMVEGGGSKIIALNKSSGTVAWEKSLSANAVSSPVAVYDESGRAWVIQGDEDGVLHMLDGQTGSERSTLDLGGSIQGSPAVYKDILVIGTCSKDNAKMYGIQLK